MNTLPSQPIKGLQDGIVILQELASREHPVSGLQLSEKLGIEKTRVNRILKTLAYMDIIYRTKSRLYTSGAGMHVLSAQSLTNSGLFKVSIRYLQKLEFFGDIIVALGVLWRDKVSYLFHHSPGMPFEEGICHIKFYPATKSSLGMVLLSRKKDEEIKEIYSDYDLIPRYKGIKELLKDIHKFRQSGYAILKNNKNVSVAVEIGFPSYAAIGISGEISNSNLNLYINVLRNISKKIAEDISNEKS